MWALVIVVTAPILNDNLSFLQRVEDLSIEEFAIMEQAHQASRSTWDGWFG